MAQAQQAVSTWPLAQRVVSGFVQPGGRAMVERAIEGVGLDGSSRVVELAPGLGLTSAALLERGPRAWTGVDPDPVAVGHLGRSLGAAGRDVLRAPVEATGLDEACAGAVVADALLSTLSDAGRALVLAEAARLLRAGGRMVLHDIASAPDGDDARDARAGLEGAGVGLLSVEAWRAAVEDAGLVVVGSLVGPLDLAAPRELMREAGPRTALAITREMATEAIVRSGALAAHAALTHHALALRSVVVVAEMPLILGMRRPRR